MNKIFKIVIAFALILSIITPFSVSTSEAATKTYSATVNIKSGTLNVREKASAKSKIIGSLEKGTKVTVYVKNKKQWATIKYKNKKAYVVAEYLKYPTTQAEYYEIAKIKGENLKKSTDTFIVSLNEGNFETIADISYEKLEKELKTVSTYIAKNVKNKKKREGLMKSYISPAQVQLDRVIYEREMFFVLRDTERFINNLKFERAKKRFEAVDEFKGKGESKRKTNNIESLPSKTVAFLDSKTKEIHDRFDFSYIEQMPEIKELINSNRSTLLPINKFLNNRNKMYTHGIFTNWDSKYLGYWDDPNFTRIYLNKDGLKGGYIRFTGEFTLNEYWKTHNVGSGEVVATLKIGDHVYKLQDGEDSIPFDIDLSKTNNFQMVIGGSKMAGVVDAKLYRENN